MKEAAKNAYVYTVAAPLPMRAANAEADHEDALRRGIDRAPVTITQMRPPIPGRDRRSGGAGSSPRAAGCGP